MTKWRVEVTNGSRQRGETRSKKPETRYRNWRTRPEGRKRAICVLQSAIYNLQSSLPRLLLAVLVTAAASAGAGLNPGWARAHALGAHLRGASPAVPPQLSDSDIVVGLTDTLETRVISGAYAHSGNVIVLNHGTLILDHADFRLRGNVYVYNSGTLRIRAGRFTVAQQFAYEFTSAATGAGRIELDSTLADFGGWSWSMLVADSAALSVRSSNLRNGFATIVPVARAGVEYSDSDFSSEFVIFDSCHVTLTDCDSVLPWLHFPDGSTADLALAEPDTTILHWELNDSTPGVSGIRYSLTLDTVAHVLWGCFPLPGSNVTFRDSRLRITGLIIPGSDSLTIAGLVNNQHYADYTLPLADRTYRLINTDLTTWNLYPSDSVQLVVNSSVFGELLAQGSCRATIQSSICDGTGGYIGSESKATLLFLGSLINTQVVSRDRSLMLGGLSSVFYGPVTSTDASAMLLLFCTTERDPVARDTSLLYICDYRIPDGATVEADLAIIGTADIRPGPFNPASFASYRFSYASADSQTVWHPIGTTHVRAVVDDTLETWDTHGLEPGGYVLKLTLYNSYGDSLEPVKGVNLGYAGIADRTTPDAARLTLEATPNPCRGPVTITVSPAPNPQSPPPILRIFDATGCLVRTLGIRNSSFVIDLSSFPPGVYVVALESGNRRICRKLVVAARE
jgi:hypothetical protein